MTFQSEFTETSLPTPSSQSSGVLIVGFQTDIYYYSGPQLKKIDAYGNETVLYSGISQIDSIRTFGVSVDGSFLILIKTNLPNGQNITAYSTITNSIIQYTPGLGSNVIDNVAGNIAFISNTNFYISNNFSNILYMTNVTLNNDNTYSATNEFSTSLNLVAYGAVINHNNVPEIMGVHEVLNDDTYFFDFINAPIIISASSNHAPYKSFVFANTINGLFGPYYYLLAKNITFIDRYDVNFNFIDSFQLTGVGVGTTFINYSTTPQGSYERFYISGDLLRKLFFNNGGSAVGGDPHVKSLLNGSYMLPNEEKSYNLFDNIDDVNRVIINCKCWFLLQDVINSYPLKLRHKMIFKNFTYMRYIQIIFNGKFIIIDLEGLKVLNDKSVDGIIVQDVYENKSGLYNINGDKYRKKGTTLERIIIINSDIKITLSFAPENTDRNNINLNFKSNKEINKYNYKGALIYNSDWIIEDFI
jgi:hypothetical protein